MGKFKFRFDSIINVKEILEKKIQEEIYLIDREINETQNQLTMVIEERLKAQQKMMEKMQKVAEFQSSKMYDALLEKQIIFLKHQIEKLNEKKELKYVELVERKKEHKILDTLKENQRQEFMIEERRAELKELNEIAIRNYNGEQN